MKKINIIVVDWEMQCCGTPFKIGSAVSWKIRGITEKSKYYEELEMKADYYYDGHDFENKLPQVKGIVTKIQKVYRKFELKNPQKNFYVPVDFKFHDFDGEATGWEDNVDGYWFNSYLVELEIEND